MIMQHKTIVWFRSFRFTISPTFLMCFIATCSLHFFFLFFSCFSVNYPLFPFAFLCMGCFYVDDSRHCCPGSATYWSAHGRCSFSPFFDTIYIFCFCVSTSSLASLSEWLLYIKSTFFDARRVESWGISNSSSTQERGTRDSISSMTDAKMRLMNDDTPSKNREHLDEFASDSDNRQRCEYTSEFGGYEGTDVLM